MKKILMLVVALVAWGWVEVEGQDRIEMDELIRRAETLLHPSTMKPYSGVAYTMHDPNTLATWVEIANGKHHGITESYSLNGQLTQRVQYEEGKLHGLFEDYATNDGSLRTKAVFEGGEMKWKEDYFGDGSLNLRVGYDQGLMHGPYYFLSSGSGIIQGTYNYGEECGEWIKFGKPQIYPPCTSGSVY